MLRIIALLSLVICLYSCSTHKLPATGVESAFFEGGGTGSDSAKLASEINWYRQKKGLEPVTFSVSLTRVAHAHAADLEANHSNSGQCNMHSWSRRGRWTPCCYTPDHAQAACMWNKPAEITGGVYQSPGFEIVAYFSDRISPLLALEIWHASSAHSAVILNTGRWANNRWRAMGAALSEHYAVIWFGEARDPVGR